MRSSGRFLVLAVIAFLAACSLAQTAQAGQQPPPAQSVQPPSQQTPAPTTAPRRPASPPGTAATQVGGKWVTEKPGAAPRYTGGKWIEITYSRPILRGRTDIFGSGADYGKQVNSDAPVWRAGANQTTRLKTEVPLVFGGKTLPAGDYSVFVDLKPQAWTLIFSKQPFQEKYDPANKTQTWGSYNYDQAQDVLRVPMTVTTLPYSMDQFTIGFVDMTPEGGKLAMWWEKTMASAPFSVGQ